jgi:hypothetical protein
MQVVVVIKKVGDEEFHAVLTEGGKLQRVTVGGDPEQIVHELLSNYLKDENLDEVAVTVEMSHGPAATS